MPAWPRQRPARAAPPLPPGGLRADVAGPSAQSGRLLFAVLIVGFYLTRPLGVATADTGGHGYRTDYMEGSCGCASLRKCTCDSFTLSPITNGAGHVVLSKCPDLYSQFSCQFTIVAPEHKTVQLVINNISIPETRDCKAGILRVYDGKPGGGGFELARACGTSISERVVRSKTGEVTLYYYQGPDILWDNKAFNITYTYVHEHNPEENQLCNSTTEYLCANKLCISRSLKCDGYDNCGDSSEELMDVHVCGGKYNKSDPVVSVAIGSIVGVVLVLGLLSAFAYWIRRRAGPLFTDAQLHRNVEGDGDDQPEPPDDNAVRVVDLAVPDLTRDLIDRGRMGGNYHSESPNGNVSQSELSSIDVYAGPDDGPPPSYSSLFPDLV